MSKCQVVKQNRPVYCETYNCNKLATFSIGNPQGPLSKMINYCEDCFHGIVATIPKELIYKTPKEQETVTPEEEQQEEVKIYTCEDCGEEFDILQKYAAHRRFCKKE
jgi:hypothetical protein